MAETGTLLPSGRSWPAQGEWTYDDWLELPDDLSRYEVIDGVLYVTPAPSTHHQRAAGNLLVAMHAHARTRGLGEVFVSPIGVRLPSQPVPVEPDLVFVAAAHRAIVREAYIEGVPDLVVEILSPSSRTYDRTRKLQLYEENGVPEYWIVDERAETVEVLALESSEYVPLGAWGRGERATSRALPGFAVAVDEIFVAG